MSETSTPLIVAIEDAGIPRDKATRIATVIIDAISNAYHQLDGAKAEQEDLSETEADLRGEYATLRADVHTAGETLRADMQGLRAEIAIARTETRTEMREGFARQDVAFARQDVAIEQLRSSHREMENRIILRLGTGIVVIFGLFFAALHAWPPH
jgi:ribosomal protein L29